MAYLFTQFLVYILVSAAIGLFAGYVIWGQDSRATRDADPSGSDHV